MVSNKKKDLVQELIKKVKTVPIIGVVNLENLPAQQVQKMRKMLRENGVKIIMARKKLLKLALSGSGKDNITELENKMKGLPA